MSGSKNLIRRRQYRERTQDVHRSHKYPFLEKKKDWKIRGDRYKKQQTLVFHLAEKARSRNEEEFSFRMLKAKQVGSGVDKLGKKTAGKTFLLSPEQAAFSRASHELVSRKGREKILERRKGRRRREEDKLHTDTKLVDLKRQVIRKRLEKALLRGGAAVYTNWAKRQHISLEEEEDEEEEREEEEEERGKRLRDVGCVEEDRDEEEGGGEEEEREKEEESECRWMSRGKKTTGGDEGRREKEEVVLAMLEKERKRRRYTDHACGRESSSEASEEEEEESEGWGTGDDPGDMNEEEEDEEEEGKINAPLSSSFGEGEGNDWENEQKKSQMKKSQKKKKNLIAGINTPAPKTWVEQLQQDTQLAIRLRQLAAKLQLKKDLSGKGRRKCVHPSDGKRLPLPLYKWFAERKK